MSWILSLLCVAILVLWSVGAYSRLLNHRQRIKLALAHLNAQSEGRHGLIPRLVELDRAYMKQEFERLDAVLAACDAAKAAQQKARLSPVDQPAQRKMAQADVQLSAQLRQWLALADAYPDLKADIARTQLAEELAASELRIGLARQACTEAIDAYNVAIRQFPANLMARVVRFQPSPGLES